MRVKSLFLAGLLAVGLPGFIAAGLLAVTELQQWRAAAAAAAATRLFSDVERAQSALLQEVGDLQTAALATSPDLQAVQASSVATDSWLDAAQRRARQAGFDDDAPRRTKAALVEVRQSLSTALLHRQAANRSDPDADGRTAAFLRRLAALRNEESGHLVELDKASMQLVSRLAPDIAGDLAVALEIMDMRFAAGGRNLLITSWIAGKPILPDNVSDADIFTGRLQQAWDSASGSIEVLATAPRLHRELARQRQSFAGRDEPRWRSMMKVAHMRLNGAPTAPWPDQELAVNVAAYRAWSVPALSSFLALRDAALDDAIADSGMLAGAAQRPWCWPLRLPSWQCC